MLYGRPSTQVIPDGWDERHAPVANGTHTVPVKARHPGTTEAWDDDSEQVKHVPHAAYWEGLARVQALGGQDTPTAGGDVVHLAGYLVAVPLEVAVDPGDLVTVGPELPADPTLEGRTILINDVSRGALRFERVCYGDLTDDT